MNATKNIVGVDLGAESGRLVLCQWAGDHGQLREIHRFPNGAREEDGHLVWDVEYIWQEILKGLRVAARETQGQVDGIGIDGWAVDYVLLDRAGNRNGRAYCYRDPRNLPEMERAFSVLPKKRIYEITGIQFLPFNTLYQLLAHIREFPEEWENAALWLNLPEYFLFRMTGVGVAEYTNATHTQMLDASSRTWSRELTQAFKLSLDKFPPVVQPGTVLGNLRPELATGVGLSNTRVVAPACHDTGSAVAGIPFPHERLAFISSGTWSLVGTVLQNPVVSDQAFQLNFTNEGGVGNTIRFLKNVTGLWLFQECLREWKAQGYDLTAEKLAERREGISTEGPFFPVAEKTFLAPGNMVARIKAALKGQGFTDVSVPADLAGSIFRSLARRYAEVIKEVQKTTGKTLERLCIVGGGVRNEALNSLTGSYTGLEIVRGPSESSAGGNVAVQIAALENTHSSEQIQMIASRLTY